MKSFLVRPTPAEKMILRAQVLGKPREYILAHPEIKMSKIQKLRYAGMLWKFRRGYPIAYLTGYRAFYGLDFLVNKHTLVPRPETELMVELVIEKIKNTKKQKIILIDIGTGSGCIPIAIAREKICQTKIAKNELQIFASDISKKALKVAQKNAEKHGACIAFSKGNLLKPHKKTLSSCAADEAEIILTANLPYLTKEQFDNEPSIQKEPRSALIANDNGLALYKKLLEQFKLLVTVQSLQATLFMEIDPSQGEIFTSYIESTLPSAKVIMHKDLREEDRIAEIQWRI